MVRYNFYQSPIWKTIQKDIYQRPTFSLTLFGKEYFGVIKEKKIGPFTMKRYQILGLELPDDEEAIKKEFARIKKEFAGAGNIYFQFGIINEIFVYDIEPELGTEFVENIVEMRKGVDTLMHKNYGLCPAFVENMPLANVMYTIPQQEEEFYDWFFSGKIRRKIRKSFKDGMEFRAVKLEEKDIFWKHWMEIAQYQQFVLVDYNSYSRLFDYLKDSGNGEIFATFMDGEMMSGGIYLFDDKVVSYIYGFNRRLRENLGGQHALTYAALKEFATRGFEKMDACGVSPLGMENHHLSTITYVKEALVGDKIEYYGNFDLVFNKLLYKLYKLLRR